MNYETHPVSIVSATFAALEDIFTGAVASVICEKLSFRCEGICRNCGLHFLRYQGFADHHFGVCFCTPACSDTDRRNRKMDFWTEGG